MPPFIEESEYVPAEMSVVRHGRSITPDFFRILNTALPVLRHCAPPETANILKLGAGCGHLARLLKLLISGSHYAIVDIPETLCFSYMFLRLTFPKLRVVMVTHPSQFSDALLAEHDFLFIPSAFAEGLIRWQFHVFINTASMGEMKNHVIEYWVNFVQQ